MKKIYLVFPGQGSQYVGMAKLFKNYFDQASDTLNFDLTKLANNGPIEKLTLTQYAQPAIVCQSIAWFELLKKHFGEKLNITAVLGHSVGEYSALYAAGVFSFKDVIEAVHLRGKFMQEAVPAGVGGMSAVLKVPAHEIELACKEVSTFSSQNNNDSIVSCANYNEPQQVVVSGHLDACKRLAQKLKSDDRFKARIIPLKVSAPFHSTLMKPACEKMQRVLDQAELKENKIPYIANVDAKIYGENTATGTIKKNLIRQIAESVFWTQSIEKIGPEAQFIELGPGKILNGLISKIDSSHQVFSIDESAKDLSASDIEKSLLQLENFLWNKM